MATIPNQIRDATIPNQNDVLFGRGLIICKHHGNHQFRTMVKAKKETFLHTSKRAAKRDIAIRIMEQIQSLRPPGRFLMEGKGDVGPWISRGGSHTNEIHDAILGKVWVVVDRNKAINKVLHRLREKDNDNGVEGEDGSVSGGIQQSSSSQKEDQNIVLQPASAGAITSNTQSGRSEGGAERAYASFASGAGAQKQPPESDVTNRKLGQWPNTEHCMSMNGSTSTDLAMASYQQFPPTAQKQPELVMDGLKQEGLSNTGVSSGKSGGSGHMRGMLPANSMEMTTMHSVNSSTSSISISAKEWAKLFCLFPSKTAYIQSTVDLAWKITEHICQTLKGCDTKLENHLASEDVIISVNNLPGTDGNSCGPPSIMGVKIETEASGVLSLLPAANYAGPALSYVSSCSSAVCVALGKLLLELFSMGRLRYAELQGPCSDDILGDAGSTLCSQGSQAAPLKKRLVTLPDGGSKSSMAKNLMLDLGVPSSVCRLVSDLLDAESQSTYGESLALTYKVALWDLTQMKTEPQQYLFDRTCPQQALGDTFLYGNTSEHLFGREKEIKVLQAAKDKVIAHVDMQAYRNSSVQSQEDMILYESVFLSGYAGGGKSALLYSLVKSCTDEQWFVLGCKFDKNAAPHMILAKAFNDFFGKWLEGHNSSDDQHGSLLASFHQVCQHVFAKVDGDGFNHLCELVPNFARLFPAFASRNTANSTTGMQSMDKVGSAEKRLRYLFHVLFKSLCSVGRPVLFTLDDLQWSGTCVMEYLKFVIDQDTSAISREVCLQGIFFLGTYRSNELGEGDSLMKNIHKMKESLRSNVTVLNVGELQQREITKLISAKLCLPLRYTHELAEIVHSKTRGNPFHVNQFMRCIIQNKMLQFSVKSRRWEWDNDVVDMQMISDGVAGLLTSTFNQLPSALLQTIKLVSCLGFQVEVATIEAMNSENEVLSFDMHEQLQAAVKEGILEKAGPLYQFTHDIVQQTVYDLIPCRVRHLLHKTIGGALLSSTTSNPTTQLLAVDQINLFCRDGTPSPEERSQFAQSNARAAKRAVAVFSFDQAQSYIDAGMVLLGTHDTTHWSTDYHLSLDLFELQARVSCMRGDNTTMSKCLDTILCQAQTFDDTLAASSLLIKLLVSNGKFDQALVNCIAILSSLGEPISIEVDPSHVKEDLLWIQTALKIITYDNMKSLPAMTDRKKLLSMQFLSMLRKVCTHAKPMLLPSVGARMLRLTIEFGLCSESIIGLVVCGFIKFLFADDFLPNDLLEGYRIGKVGERLIQDHPSKHILQVQLCLELDCSLKQLVEPQQKAAELLPHRYESAMLVGDIQNALLYRVNFCGLSFFHGSQLNLVSEHLVTTIRELSKYQQRPQYYSAISYLRTTLFLAGKHADGAEMKSHVEVDIIAKETNNAQLALHNFMCSLSQHFWMGEYKDAIMLLSTREPPKYRRIFELMLTFYEGVVSLSVARETRDPKLREVGKKAVKKMIRLEQLSKWNYENQSKLLQAELHYLDGDLIAAETAYKASIKSSREHQYLHEEALAHERYGMFCIENQMVETGLAQLQRALEKYKEWGAMRVHDKLQHIILNALKS